MTEEEHPDRCDPVIPDVAIRRDILMEYRPKVLIVDDKQGNLFALDKVLQGSGAEIIKSSGGISHRLSNPLGAIKNAAYFLNTALEEPAAEVKEAVEGSDDIASFSNPCCR